MTETGHKRASDPGGVPRAQARQTALVVSAILSAVAAWQLSRGRTTVAAVVVGLALLLLVAGLFVPALARRFHVYWMRVAGLLGSVNSRVLLALIYYVVFTPYRLFSRLAGRDPLRRRGPAQESYWVERQRTRQKREGFERLF